jgi:histidyl-tRNA synthetase
MDILGDGSILAEIDTIATTAEILSNIFNQSNISGVKINLNDRRILIAAANYAGFNSSETESVLIALDKNDKIGLSGVSRELLGLGFDQIKVEKFIDLFKESSNCSVDDFCSQLQDFSPDQSIIEDIKRIMSTVNNMIGKGINIMFNPTLVRGMGYYTGPIFECSVADFSSSVAGGGRYDKMIGKFSGGADVSACGFSIGFERIIAILDEAGFVPPKKTNKLAFLVDKEVSEDRLKEVFARANDLRRDGTVVTILALNKNVKYQVETLEKCGYIISEKVFK